MNEEYQPNHDDRVAVVLACMFSVVASQLWVIATTTL